MGTKYLLKVENHSKNYQNICIFQKLPDQLNDVYDIAWFSKGAHPGTAVKFDWNTDYSSTWSEQEELRLGTLYRAPQALDADSADTVFCAMCEDGIETNSESDQVPRYYVAVGDFDNGEAVDVSALENAVELSLEDMGKTIVINEDNTISIE